jgi:hypothetical protein
MEPALLVVGKNGPALTVGREIDINSHVSDVESGPRAGEGTLRAPRMQPHLRVSVGPRCERDWHHRGLEAFETIGADLARYDFHPGHANLIAYGHLTPRVQLQSARRRASEIKIWYSADGLTT